jgi:transcriptional regulator with GAF, ATPase, and Fis domain
METVFRHQNGKLLNVLLSSTQISTDNDSTEVTFNIIDITQSRQVEQKLSWQNRELAALHRVSEIMLSGQPEQEIFDAIAGEIAGVTDFPMVSIELCDFERAVMIYRGAFGIPLADMPTPFEVPMDVTLSGEVAHTGSVLIETETFNRREYAAPILRRLGVQTFVCIPIKSRDKVIGTLSLAHDKKIEIEPRIMVAATSLANYLATLLDRYWTACKRVTRCIAVKPSWQRFTTAPPAPCAYLTSAWISSAPIAPQRNLPDATRPI